MVSQQNFVGTTSISYTPDSKTGRVEEFHGSSDVNRSNTSGFEQLGAVEMLDSATMAKSAVEHQKSLPDTDQGTTNGGDEPDNDADQWAVGGRKKRYFGFLRSRVFWIVLVLGQVLSLCITCTNTLTTFLDNENASMPLFQNLLNYGMLAIVFNSITIYRYGFKKWARILVKDSWRFFILAFADVEGNYFVVKAYQYTNILSASLLDNFAIVVVVALSLIFLKVRYHWSQYIGVIVSIGGMAMLIVSDHLTGKDYSASDPVKGDLFVLLGAACYGVSNTFEEFLVSERPLYEVLGFLGFWASGINGVQLAIFERSDMRKANWNGKVGGYLVGYAGTMFLLYNLAPLVFRLSSAAFYNLSMLTSDFWSLLVGTEEFGYKVYWLYPIGFVCVIIGVVCYCAAPMSTFGESLKPWLGENQEKGVAGLGTAKARLNAAKRRQQGSADSQSNDPNASLDSNESLESVVSETANDRVSDIEANTR